MLNRRTFVRHLATGTAALAGAAYLPSARILGANDRVRFGIIGPGGRGLAIFKNAMQSPNTQAVAAADVYTRRVDEAKEVAPGISTYADFRRLLDDKSIDAVLIATPQHQHALNFVPAIQAGKDVYQEKTMAFTPDHARRMRDALKASHAVVQVGYQAVSGPAFTRARELAKSDKLGTVTAIHTHHYRNAAYGGWRRDIPSDCNLDHVQWKEFEGEAQHHDFDPNRYINWRFFWDYSGGNFFENMVHAVAFWYKVFDLNIPRHATTAGYNYFSPDMQVPDTMDVSLDLPENILFTWNSAFGNDYYGENGSDLAFGRKGTILRSAESVTFLPQGGHGSRALKREGTAKDSGRKPDIVGDSDETQAHMNNFFDCVRSRKEPNGTFEIGYRSAIACQMAVAALRAGRSVSWDPQREDIV